MSSRVRLLPALIGAAGVLLMLRVGAMASGAEQTQAGEGAGAQTPVAENSATPGTEPTTTSAEPAPRVGVPAVSVESAPQPASQSQPQAQSKGEAEVLQNLGLRRSMLDARERDLALREQLLSATEKRVSENLVELKGLETRLNAMLAQRDAGEEAQLASLVKTYENMKPADAAKIFNKLDRQVMVSLAQRMKPAKIAAVMAAMEPSRAQDLTVMLALRLSLPRPQPSIAAAAQSAPAPVVQPQPAAEPTDPPHS